MDMVVKIVGNGALGKAVYSVVKNNCETVSYVLHGEKIGMFDVLILCVPTQAIREVLLPIFPLKSRKIIINSAKGIEKNTHFLPHQIVKDIFSDSVDYYSLIGPSFAKEVIEKMPTLVNIGSETKSVKQKLVHDLFETPYFRVAMTKGVAALELSAAFKNIYAIGAGIGSGLGYLENTRVKLLVLAIDEIRHITEQLNFPVSEDMTAGTIGDLILTCHSHESRNFTFGRLLTAHKVEKALDLVSATVEGYHSLTSIAYFKNKASVSLPLADFIHAIIDADSPETVATSFASFVATV